MEDFTLIEIDENDGRFKPRGFLIAFDSKTDAEQFLIELNNSDPITLELCRESLENQQVEYRQVGDAFYNHQKGKVYEMVDGTFARATVNESKNDVAALWKSEMRPSTLHRLEV